MQPFPVTRIAHIRPKQSRSAWLVEDLWGDQAVGFIGGMPKAGKTWLAIELAVAVASGRPCLGRYPVRRKGHVLLHAAEDTADDIKHRAVAVASARGIKDLERLAVGLITVDGLRLDDPEHQDRLDATIDKLKPRLLILDPLVRLHRADENSAADLGQLLDYLRGLQRKHALAVALVHHVRKSAAAQPGQALRGTGDLHAWSDSNLYLLRSKKRLLLHAEHRAHPAPSPVPIELKTEPAPHLHVLDEEDADDTGKEPQSRPLSRRILDILAQQPMTSAALRERLRVRNERLVHALTALEAEARVLRHKGVLRVPVPGA